MRKVPLVTDEFYHIYNRGVDKRTIFQDQDDLARFYQSIKEFNSIEPIGSIFENSFNEKQTWVSDSHSQNSHKWLVEIIAYCLNPNHFHILVKQNSDNGISEFMKRLSGGYTLYFNNKHKRSGALFQGKFKSSHIDSDIYLLHVSAYINLNNRLKGVKTFLSRSSWEEYINKETDKICSTGIVLDQFNNRDEYQKFAESSIEDVAKRKDLAHEVVYLGTEL